MPIFVALLFCLTPIFLHADSELNFPRLSFEQNTFTGVAIGNPTSVGAVVTMTAYGADGQPLSGLENPVEVTIPANQQVSRLTSDLFGGLLDPSVVAWFQATSPTDDLTGFFLFMNGTLTQLDGADLPPVSKAIVFNQVRVDSGYSTELNIINPGSTPANVQIQLVRNNGSPVTRSLPILGKGVVRLDAVTFFETAEIDPDAYVSVSSDESVAGFELVRPSEGDLLGLNARKLSEQLTHLYFPQVSVLGPFKTELSIVNYSTKAVILTVTAFKPDGTLFDSSNLQNNPVTETLGPGQSLIRDVASMFGFSGNEAVEGWLEVEATSESINGFISHGIPEAGSVASIPALGQPENRALFSHIATVEGFFTGLTVLNSGQLATNVRVLAINASGEVLGIFSAVLQPGQQLSELIDELIPSAAGQGGGFIWVSSDLPVHSSALFGSTNILSNIAPQASPVGFQPDAGLTLLSVSPPLAIVQPSKTQQFQISGGGESVTWQVNGIEGGDSEIGLISGSGLYTAPSGVPDPRVVTVSADSNNQAAGASLDVLDKQALFSSLAVVQSVAFLGSLQNLYTAELTILSGAGQGAQPAEDSPEQEVGESEVFEVGPGGVKVSLAQFPGEEISKMISFQASNGSEFLLLALQTSGKIVRLNPLTQEAKEVAVELNQPSSMVIDPISQSLFVAELDKITTIPRSQLEVGFASSLRIPGDGPTEQKSELFSIPRADGIVVNTCSGNIFISNRVTGEILELVRSTGEVRTVVEGLSEPTRLLGLFRSRISCPDSFQLLAIERGSDRIVLVTPLAGRATRWISALESTDLIFIDRENPFIEGEAVALTEALEFGPQQAGGSSVFLVGVLDLYQPAPINPPPPPEVDEQVIILFQDVNLEAVVREALELDQETPITKADVDTLTELDASGRSIIDLGGLEFFANLQSLLLGNNEISDLSSLSGLISLTNLDLSQNQISDLTPLGGLTLLTSLDVGDNRITDSAALSRLTALNLLDLTRNQLASLSGLSGLNSLNTLLLSSNRITDISSLSGMFNLEVLNLEGNLVADLSPLEGLGGGGGVGVSSLGTAQASASANLRTLNLGRNRLTEIGPLAGLTGLTELLLGNNSISQIDALSGLIALAELDLSQNRVGDLGPLSGLNGLNSLDLSSNPLVSLSPLVANPGLTTGDEVIVTGTLLDVNVCDDVVTLLGRGVAVIHDVDCRAAVLPPLQRPALVIENVTASAGGPATVGVSFLPGAGDGSPGGPDEISAIVFSIDFDPTRLSFDATDGDGDGLADSIQVNPGVLAVVLSDPSDADGELDIALLFIPPARFPEGVVVRITFGRNLNDFGRTSLLFSTSPNPSLGDNQGVSQALVSKAIGLVDLQ